MLIGEGRAFCACGDVSGMGGPTDRESMICATLLSHAWLSGLRISDAVVICTVNGVAAGGGFGLALMGDVVVASGAASFKAGFKALGVAADFVLGWTLPGAAGHVKARENLLGERRVDGVEALGSVLSPGSGRRPTSRPMLSIRLGGWPAARWPKA